MVGGVPWVMQQTQLIVLCRVGRHEIILRQMKTQSQRTQDRKLEIMTQLGTVISCTPAFLSHPVSTPSNIPGMLL
jgi:hypothetical protein